MKKGKRTDYDHTDMYTQQMSSQVAWLWATKRKEIRPRWANTRLEETKRTLKQVLLARKKAMLKPKQTKR